MTARNPDGIDPGRPGPTLAVLMATKNGGPFLDEQLRSLEAQTYARIDLWVSDDGSDDSTLQLLATWTNRWKKGRMTVLRGPRQGFAENFRSLLLNADIDAEFFAYCDQDDIWEERKTERAVSWLSTIPAALPALFCSRTLTISESGEPVGVSRLFRREPSFRNALVQSIAGGNTMTFNRAARDLVADASRTASFISHDWWTYLLVTGSGGAVHYSAEPLVRYRQHRDNQVGANGSFRAMLVRLKRLAHGDFVHWTTANIEGLSRNSNLLTEDAREALVQLANSRMRGWRERVESLRSSGVYRQSRAGNLALYLAAALGRL